MLSIFGANCAVGIKVCHEQFFCFRMVAHVLYVSNFLSLSNVGVQDSWDLPKMVGYGVFGHLISICRRIGICFWSSCFLVSVFFVDKCVEVANGLVVCGG